MSVSGSRLLGLLGLSAVLASGCLVGVKPAASPTPGAQFSSDDLRSQLAVVNITSLLELHPDYEKLKDLDAQIRTVERERQEVSEASKRQILKQSQDQFFVAYRDAKAEMESEQAALQGEMEGLARALQGQMGAEMAEIKARLDEELRGEVGKYRPPETALLNDRGEQAVSEYHQNLKLMASRNLTAHRLEQEKSVRSQLDSERSRLDQELAAYEDEVGLRYQEEKLNLQLKMQNNPNEETERTTRERLNAIDDEVAAAKADKRKEIEAAMGSFQDRKQAEFESEMKAYESSLQGEMLAKVSGRREELKYQPTTSQAPPPEVQAKIAAANAQMEQAMQSRKAELEARMKQKGEQARAQLEAKQAQIKERLARLEKELEAKLADQMAMLDKKSKLKLEQLDQQMEKTRADYKLMLGKMRDEIAVSVAKVAAKKEVPCVIGTWVVNLEMSDLSDLSSAEVRQIGSRQ